MLKTFSRQSGRDAIVFLRNMQDTEPAKRFRTNTDLSKGLAWQVAKRTAFGIEGVYHFRRALAELIWNPPLYERAKIKTKEQAT